MAARKTGKPAKQTISSPGKAPISFQPGGLHKSTGTPEGQKIPPAKMQAALSGKLGPKAKAQANFARNVLTGPKRGKSTGKGK